MQLLLVPCEVVQQQIVWMNCAVCRSVLLLWRVPAHQLCSSGSGEPGVPTCAGLLYCSNQPAGQQTGAVCAVWLSIASQPSAMLISG